MPIRRAPLLSTGGAFISYVRRRGEPDGGRTDPSDSIRLTNTQNALDNSLANTTDSELSDGYTAQTLNKNDTIQKRIGYSSLRGPVRVSRPGGGGESDAAFTPSPPVTIQNVDSNVSLALAHQTRIRNLYSSTGSLGATHFLSDNSMADMANMMVQNSRRPDSSSSASSTTDWEGSGHATVLRRAHQSHVLPPLPPPRQTMPLVDSLRPLAPLAPVYNNLACNKKNAQMLNGLESTSSDSEFEKGFEMPHTMNSMRGGRSKMKQPAMSRKVSEQIGFMDRLSVRTEISANASISGHGLNSRKTLTLPEDETSLSITSNNLYFSPTDSEVNQLMDAKKELALMKTSTLSKDLKAVGHHNKNIQDSIMRHMNREMTPTISEVYHERNLGLGLAPPLSKLLLSTNYDEGEASGSSLTEAVNEIDLNATTTTGQSDRCNVCNDLICCCNANNQSTTTTTTTSIKNLSTTKNLTATVPKKSSMKPWLSNVTASILKASDLTTADILERQNKIKAASISDKSASLKRSGSPFSEMSRRDEGDGRSVADSQCSSSFKVDVTGNVQQIRSKFSLDT